jgi:hypothetical protein
MKYSLFLFLSFISFSVIGQWSGPDLANRIYYSKGHVGIGVSPGHRFHLKTTDLNPLLFAETAQSTLSFQKDNIELRALAGATAAPYITWLDVASKWRAKLGFAKDTFQLSLNRGYFMIKGATVGIGVSDTKGYQLAIGGKAIAEEIVVKLQSNWPDYVFDSTYHLRPLKDVGTYLRQHKRLPEMPSAKAVVESGIEVSTITTLLVKKIEELTLYLLQERELTEQLRVRVEALEGERNQN